MNKKGILLVLFLLLGGASLVYYLDNPKDSESIRIAGSSMQPTFNSGDTIKIYYLSENVLSEINRGDILAYKFEGNNEFNLNPGYYFGRVVAFPNEKVKVVQSEGSSHIIINEQEIVEPYLSQQTMSLDFESDLLTIKDDHVLIMPDNRSTFPPIMREVNVKYIVGKVQEK